MLVRLARHACALDREEWDGADVDRPLAAVGRAQALALAELLRVEHPVALLSSPSRRCLATLEPLAAAWGVPVEAETALAVDADPADLLALIARVAEGDVLCTHGELMKGLIEVAALATDLDEERLLAKGTMWELDVVAGAVAGLRHVVPPRRHPAPG